MSYWFNFKTRIWPNEHSNALQSLKDLLCEATVKPLYIVDFSRPFNITVDASKHCVAGYLAHVDEQGQEKPVAYASQKLSDSQALSWATIEKEAYAVIFCLRKFRNWIFGSDITVYSDHGPLKYLTESAPSSSKLTRWALSLNEFSVTFKYKSSAENTVADCISRMS